MSVDGRRAAPVAKAFLTPLRRPKRSSLEVLPFGQPFWVAGPVGKVAAIQVGEGPSVLLVHGWEGEASDFSAFISGLVEAGYRVIAFDLPAHGASEGSMASIPTCVESLLEIQKMSGELHVVIGHSAGALVAAEAARRGLNTAKMVFISAPARYEDYARRYAVQAGLDFEEAEEMIEVLESMGADVRSISMPKIACHLRQEALFIHSRDDRVVPFSDSVESAGAWKGARLLQVDGWGHHRILRAPEVLEAALNFIKD